MLKFFSKSLALPLIPFMVLFSLMSCAGVSTPAPSIGTVTAVPAADTIEGEISLIEVDGTILIWSASGAAVGIEPQGDTKITRNGKTGKADELKPGDKVWVRYMPYSHEALEIRATGKD